MNAEAAGRRIEGGIAPAHTNGSGRLRQASPAREESEEEMSIIRLRIVAALSAFVLVLAACNGAGDATQTTTQPSATTAASATTSESPNTTGTAVATDIEGTLTIWAWEGAIQPLQTVDEAFNEEYPNVTLEYQMQAPADLYQNLQLGITAGSGLPDVSVIEDSHLAQFVELGALADVTDQVGPYVDQVNDYKWEEATLDGRIYAMPWDSGPVAVFYRRDIFEAAGVDPSTVKTWEDYYLAGQTIFEATGVPLWQQATALNDARLFETLMWQRGVGYVDADGNVVLDQASETQEILEFMARIWDTGLAVDSQPWTEGWYAEMNEGQVATVPGAVWMGTFLKSFIAPDTGGMWGVFPLPTWEGSARTANDGGSSLAILETSEQKDAAWAYIEFHLGRPEQQVEMYRASDIFPSLETAYDDPFFSEPDPYFDGQEVRSLFAEIVTEIPSAYVYSADYQEMNSLMQTELQKFAIGEQSAEEALANAASAIRERTGRS